MHPSAGPQRLRAIAVLDAYAFYCARRTGQPDDVRRREPSNTSYTLGNTSNTSYTKHTSEPTGGWRRRQHRRRRGKLEQQLLRMES